MIPCKDCIVFAACRCRERIQCELIIDWIWYETKNIKQIRERKLVFLELFNWVYCNYRTQYQIDYKPLLTVKKRQRDRIKEIVKIQYVETDVPYLDHSLFNKKATTYERKEKI
jgi:hypothetical protein